MNETAFEERFIALFSTIKPMKSHEEKSMILE
jgi:hypothetical protein